MKCKCPSSYTIPAYVWAFLSMIAAIMCAFGLYFSNWIEKQEGEYWTSASSFRLCLNETSRFSAGCSSYMSFNDIYSTEWKAVTLLMGLGACFLILVGLTAFFGFIVNKLFNLVVAILTFSFQLIGVLLFITGIVLFPAGMGAEEIKLESFCGRNADKFKLGECSLGWAYYVIIVGTFLGLIATVMSWTTLRWREKNREDYTFSSDV